VTEPIRSSRLDLIPAEARCLAAELDGPAALAAALGLRVPAGWPPDLYDRAAIEFSLVVAQYTPPEDAGWLSYYFVLRDDDGHGPAVVGVGGYKGPPEGGEVEVGYSVLAAYRRRGLASEAVAGLLDRAFADARVGRVTAETFPELVSSIGVLERCGFRLLGAGIDEGALRFGVRRAEWRLRLFAAGGEGKT